jgi:hypothetical protein
VSAQSEPTRPDSAPTEAAATAAPDCTDPTETTDTTEAPAEPPGLTRRERRARSGAPSSRVLGPPPGRRYPVPAKPRDYASRKRG